MLNTFDIDFDQGLTLASPIIKIISKASKEFAASFLIIELSTSYKKSSRFLESLTMNSVSVSISSF